MIEVAARHERLALREPFRIARGTKTHADVVVVELAREGARALGEGVPYPRYGESPDGVLAALAPITGRVAEADLRAFVDTLRGAAKNALASALFALDEPARASCALDGFRVAHGASTLSLATPGAMAAAAREREAAVIKIKLAGDGDDRARLEAVRAARSDLPLWLDANEGLSPAALAALLPALDRLGVVLVEQPLAAADEGALAALLAAAPSGGATPICADESFHVAGDALRVRALGYRAVNVKLDKAGGVRAAVEAGARAHDAGLVVVMGCMVSSSRAIAAARAATRLLEERGVPVPFVDLDGATFLAADPPLAGSGWG